MLPREARAAALRPLLDDARRRVAEAQRAGRPGDETARAYTAALDHIVVSLFRAAASHAAPPPVALIADGGYGREELCPGSDLDLWFITEEPEHPAIKRLTDDVLYPLWDLRLDVGHGVRAPADCLDLAKEDLAAATALLDARFLDGDEPIARRLADAWRRRLTEREAISLARWLADDKLARHAKFGDTVFLLEPNVKNGEGAYRDLLAAWWAAKARFGVRDFGDLVGIGQATARQADALVAARRFFLQVRTAAHLYAKRRQDRLTFEVQEAIAPELAAHDDGVAPIRPRHADALLPGKGGEVKPAVAPAVESLMQRYYLHAKAVKREGGRLLERCVADHPKRPRIKKIDHAFVLWNGQLSTAGPEVFRDRPSEMVRLFNVALDLGAEIYGHTRELIAEACAQPETASALARDPASAREFLTLLADERDARSPSLLEELHDLGLLAALMPEFAPCTGRVQHDLYHVFTVDQHQLYAVARLKALARGDLAVELPVATRAMKEAARRTPLYLGTLLHDVAKPLGKGHSEKGARLAAAIGRRFRLSEADQAEVEFLVRQHLLLSHVSQRRDLNDVEMIARLSETLGGPERLRDLYLLTVADMSMVAPGNLTTWKEQLLRELYVKTLAHYRHGPDLAGSERSRRIARKKEAIVAHLVAGEAEAIPRDDVLAWMRGLPDRYFAQTPSKLVARHAILSRARAGSGQAVVAEMSPRPRQGGWYELSVIADDAPGLLARIAGALLASRVDVHGAQINSREIASAPPRSEAIDVFLVRDLHQRGFDGARLDRLLGDLRRVVAGEATVERLIEERRERTGLPPRVVPRVQTEVRIDEDVSAEFSVIDVFTQDRPGVLYTITRTLSSLDLDIHLSKVATEADRVADVFYVRDAAGSRVGARAPSVVAALQAALADLP